MPKVLYYGSSTQIHSGASQWMYRLATEMDERSWDVLAVLPGDEGIASWYREEGIDLEFRWASPLRIRRSGLGHILYLLRSLVAIFSLTLLVRTEDVDVVHVNEIRYPHGIVAGKLGGAKTICHVRACFDSYLLRKLLAGFVVLFADEVVCVSEATSNIMFGEVSLNRENVHTIYDGLPSPERFDDQVGGEDFREEYEIDENSLLVLQVSKLTRNKGQDRLVSVAKRLSDSNADIEFAIIGGEVSGHESYADDLRSLVKDLDSVRLTGFYPDIVTALAAADVLAHIPRHDDPFPGVVLEGMLTENPVIGTQSGGIPEQIEDGETGFLVPKHDAVDEITSKICHLYQYEDARREMGKRAAERVRERFPVRDHFDAIEACYERAVEKPPSEKFDS